MNKLYFICFLLLTVESGFAQNDTNQFLIGEWYYFESTRPEINDTFRLNRDKIHDSYIKWEFRENSSFYEQIITECSSGEDAQSSIFIMSANTPSIWVYNKEHHAIELRDLSRRYKITGIDEKFLDLVRVK